MFYALSWFVIVALVALWSLTAWALHAAAVWTVSNAGALSGVATGSGAVHVPDWLAPWVPPGLSAWLNTFLADLGPFVDSLLQAAPALTGALGVAGWLVWGAGTVLLVLLGSGLHLLIALWRRRSGSSGGLRALIAS
jgi:hypothetical protein